MKPPNSSALVNPALLNTKREFAAARWMVNDADGAGSLSGSGTSANCFCTSGEGNAGRAKSSGIHQQN